MQKNGKWIAFVAVLAGIALLAFVMSNAGPTTMAQVPSNESINALNDAPQEDWIGEYHNEVQETTGADGRRTIHRARCGLTFELPKGWEAPLGNSIQGPILLVSPASIEASREFMRQNPDYVAEGEWGLDMPATDILIECYADVPSLLRERSWKGLGAAAQNAMTLDALLADAVFHEESSVFVSEGKVDVGGQMAFQIATAHREPLADAAPTHELFLQKEMIYAIHLGDVPYDDLSMDAKNILKGIKFDE